MKTLLSTLLILVSFSTSQAQYVKLSPNGFVLGEGQNELIINIPNKTASELYSNTLDFINKNYQNPDDKVFAKTENKYLRFTTIDRNIAKLKAMIGYTEVFGYTTYEIDFKDDKIRIYSISPYWFRAIDKEFPISCAPIASISIYTCKGVLSNESKKNNVVESIENHYNTFLGALVAHLKENNNDW